MQRKKHFVLIGLLILSLCVITSCVRKNTGDYLAEDSYGDFDWNLPVAVSVGIEPYQLAQLSNEELRLLHQPYVDIANAISTELGVDISIGTIDCYFMTRDDILYAITNISLAEHEAKLRGLGMGIRRAEYWTRVFMIVSDSGYDLQALLSAFECEYSDPVEAYYVIQHNGVAAFMENIERTTTD